MRNAFRMTLPMTLAVILLCSVAPAWGQARTRVAFSDEAVEAAIEKGKAFLWSQYQDAQGHWPERPEPQYVGGHTAIAAYALLAAGESYQEARMKKALEYLAKLEMNSTYCLGLRAQVWSLVQRDAVFGGMTARNLLAKDAKQLRDSMCISNVPNVGIGDPGWAKFGMYTYVSDGKTRADGGDHSNTQYGHLGVWAAARQNIEIPKDYWQTVANHYQLTQNQDGGWDYGARLAGNGESSLTMTAAGLASAFVALDFVSSDRFTKCGANSDIAVLAKGLAWFDKNYSANTSPYGLYGVERVGLASGYKYFGEKDWYKIGANLIVNKQAATGEMTGASASFGGAGVVDTCFCMLFLVRGRNPVLFNRLEYEGDWNNRPRALANLTHWISRTFEKDVNWQIINLKADVDEWHDAPILLISGSKAPKFAAEDLAKLRTFMLQGGMILSVVECGQQGVPFDKRMKEVYKALFPAYELKNLPTDHPMFKAHFDLKNTSSVMGISNGVRILALHVNDDLPLPWQTNSYATNAEAFRMAANVFFFASDRGSLRHRGTSMWEKPQAFVPVRAVKVARVKHTGNWDPEPLAWERFTMVMGQKWQTKVTVSEPMGWAALKPDEYRVAAVTGTTELSLTDAEKQALKAYVEGGGTLIMDAAGGSPSFSESAMKLTAELFGADNMKPLPAFSPVYVQPGMDLKSVRYRRAARMVLSETKAPRVMAATVNDRLAVFLSREDLTAGLVGFPCFTCVGYEPASAIEVMRNLVLYGSRMEKSATAPASGAASAPAK